MVAVFLAEDLRVLAHFHRHDPGGEGNPRKPGQVELFPGAEQVLAGETQGPAEHAFHAAKPPGGAASGRASYPLGLAS